MIKYLYNLCSYLHSFPRVLLLSLLSADIGARVRFYNNYLSLPWRNCIGLFIGNDVQICKWTTITLKEDSKLHIGKRTSIGKFNQIYCGYQIHIGSGCLFSDHVKVSDSRHIFNIGCSPVLSGLKPEGMIIIGDNCFIGQGVIIEPGVVLAGSCYVGAYAVLKKNSYFPKGSVIVGQPGRKVKKIDE